jgi:predicted GNAT superfamily acetyltransferase
VVAAINGLIKEPPPTPAAIELPSELEQWKLSDPEQVRRVQQRIGEEFTHWFARGHAAIGMRKTPSGTAYLLAPWSDF